MEDLSNYEVIKEDARQFYHKLGGVACPAFNNELVYFTSEGFNHLVYKDNRKERNRAEQIARFKLIDKAVKLIKVSTTFQETEETLKTFRVKKHKKYTEESKVVKYWGIIAILEGRKIKVIVRQIGDTGHKHFWSVIPSWVTNKHRDIKLITTMKGNPAED